MNILLTDYKYCPYCGKALFKKMEDGHTRSFCNTCNWTHYPRPAIAACGVIIREGHVLMVRRARGPYKGKWCMPAGFLEFGESPEETMVREVKEETGLKVTSFKLFSVKLGKDDIRAPNQLVFFYIAEVEGEIVTELSENSATMWWPVDKLPDEENLAWTAHKEGLKELFG